MISRRVQIDLVAILCYDVNKKDILAISHDKLGGIPTHLVVRSWYRNWPRVLVADPIVLMNNNSLEYRLSDCIVDHHLALTTHEHHNSGL